MGNAAITRLHPPHPKNRDEFPTVTVSRYIHIGSRTGHGEGVPDGELIHEDYLLADALVAGLDRLDLSVKTDAQMVAA